MSNYGKLVAGVTIFLSLVAGCGKSEPTATLQPPADTPVPSTPTHAPSSTMTMTPTYTSAPTHAPAPTHTAMPTATPAPPASTPTPRQDFGELSRTAQDEAATPAPPVLFSLEKSAQEFGRTGPFQIGLGDLDGDGDLDAVLANTQQNHSQVWLNDGSGNFTDTGQELTQYGHGVGLSDWDGDGDLDVFINCHFFVSHSKVYLNDGNATFEDTGQDLGDAGISGADLNLVDLDGDGNTDVHVLYYDPDGLPDKVYLNDGQGVFRDSGLALDEETIAWGDLDGDGDSDYFGKRWGTGYVVQLNDGGGQFSPGWHIDDSDSTLGGVALADLDNDGDLDALVANGFRSTGGQPSRLFWNDGSGQFSDSGQVLNETIGSELAVGDVDGDGDLDVFVSNMDLPNELWLNAGSGKLVDSGLRLEGRMSARPTLGDVDGDGDLDVFVGSLGGRAELWFNNGPVGATDGHPLASVDGLASLQGLPIDEFFEQSFRQLLLRDPDNLVWEGLAKEYGIENDRFSDISDAYARETQQLESAVLDLLHSYDREALAPGQQLSYDVYEWYLDDRVRGHEFTYYDYPVNSFSIASADFVILDLMTDILPISDKKDAEDYVVRLSQFDVWMEQLLEGLEIREQAGVVPPRLMVLQSLDQVGEHVRLRGSDPFEEIELYTSLRDRLEQIDDISVEEKQSLLAAARTEIEDTVVPAYVELGEYVLHLRDIATDDAGLARLQRGREYYAYLLRHHTTTNMSAGEIHQLGLAEVERLQAEMKQMAHAQLGYPQDVSMQELTRRFWEEGEPLQGEALLAEFQRLLEGVQEASLDYFDLFPQADLVVEFDPRASVNYYRAPAADGSRPGVYFATTGGMPSTLAPVVFYHEAIPGHHVDSALERDLPTFRKLIGNSAYSEGWALYAERLAWEMGLFEDDAPGNLGRLQMELIRAARLVIDTGLHDQGWTWDEGTSYLNRAIGMEYVPESLVRFITLPGQGCAYTIGYLKIIELRQRAMDQLGAQFDIKEFHNVLLGNGNVPLEILEQVVDDWIAETP